MIILGLTGSIGMGKSTVAGFFAKEGVPVYSADKAAHALYKKKEIAAEIAKIFPQAVADGAVDRQKLAQSLFAGKKPAEQKQAVARLEAIIHPYIRAEEEKFVQKAREQRHWLAVLDIPLLLETMAEDKTALCERGKTGLAKDKRVDYIAVVSAPYEVQKARVLARPNMNAEKFAAMLAQQMSDAEKRGKADFIIDTAQDLAQTRRAVQALMRHLVLLPRPSLKA
ncbi:MAG: dephospho-CoA kinase [Candidatus Tokpelaia sp.]|uniref:dephospho-CoA kinase n=1 Tax=Candidatus Tokpelaia sp. TaxID=2233777 RepID=UPI001238670B|nr:dephospho-CoA kinase [Candidatus Tokpelaia sp.]KAA6206020.1 MAG: dephospho-CoA kinase [Candidatus Tokpelaia sp.]KAA6206313.1 MAG: dephospho-CoA kinase [Candidatus Tokpelaia sp.]KAA6406328.1 dephospho-CoA kinase [Candidatus Tokpelaia sp.]